MLWLPVILPAFVSLLIGFVLVRYAITLGHRYSLLDLPGQHKRHKRPVPILGGAALFLTFWLGLAVVALSPLSLPIGFWAVAPYVMAGALILFLVGFSDDLKPVSPWIKLSAQCAAGLVLYMGGLNIDPVSIPFAGSVSLGWPSLFITLLWVVGLTNAINLIDGLDGLAAGVCLIAAITMGGIGLLFEVASVVLFSSLLAGFLVVFLFYNRYPAKLFLGDSGSLQLGYYFAVMSLLVPLKSYTAAALYLPLLVLAVPLIETATSVFRRLVSRKGVMTADRRHIFHFLALAGIGPRGTVLIFYLLSALFGLFTLAMYYWNRRIVFGILVLFMVVIFAAFFILLSNLNRKYRDRTGVAANRRPLPDKDKSD